VIQEIRDTSTLAALLGKLEVVNLSRTLEVGMLALAYLAGDNHPHGRRPLVRDWNTAERRIAERRCGECPC
jgi:hypothetical protein